jgi:hypothetical protein
MPRQKKTSRILEKSEIRAAGIRAIDPNLNLGNDLNLRTMMDLIEKLRSRIDAYNTALAVVDSSKSEIADLERRLNQFSEKMMIGIAFTYGNDSAEYEMAGGVKKSDRVRRSIATRLKSKAEAAADKTA